jgi:hypothetical protein
MKRWWFAFSILALSLSGCIPFTSFQSARIVPRHETQATFSAAWTNYRTDQDMPAGWTYLDARLRSGITSRIDGALGATVMVQSGTGGLGGILGADIRGAVWKGHLAVVMPLSVILGDTQFVSLMVQPGVIMTVPISDRWDISAAARRHLYVTSLDSKPMWSCDLGVGVPLPREGWTLRPEVGLLFERWSENTYINAGVGLEIPAR